MSYVIVNFDHLNGKDVAISLTTAPDKWRRRDVLKLVLQSKENKLIFTLSDEQADRLASVIDEQLSAREA